MTGQSPCLQCGTSMRRAREDRPYTVSGLPHVTLVGVEVWRCPRCGEEEEVVSNIEDLHAKLAHALAAKKARLTPQEIRFLRTWLGLSSTDLARRIGVTKQTVSRWERVDAPLAMKTSAERLLRLMVLHERPVEHYPVERLDETAIDRPRGLRLRARHADAGWRLEPRA